MCSDKDVPQVSAKRIAGCRRHAPYFEHMFDVLPGSSPLDADVVEAVVGVLSNALRAPSGLDDAQRIDSIRALERLVCVATAAQAALSAELDTSQRAEQSSQGVPGEQQGRGVAAQVALARRESHHRGQRHLGLAKIVTAELPHLWSAWRSGRVTEWKATLVARETACLTREDRLAVDAAVCTAADRLEQMGDRELAAACQKVAYRLDPASYVTRRRQAEADRNVTLRPAPDAMTWLTALLPVKEGVAAYAALTREADSARATGDARTRGQVMADALVGAVAARAEASRQTEARWDPTPLGASSEPPGPAVTVGLVMSDAVLFGESDEPAHMEGYGPVPAELAREIVARACDHNERVWLRRLYTSPTTGELVAMDSRARLFRNSLARFIRLRDQVCRTPWCDAPIRHVDHLMGAVNGGDTSADNGQGLCEACNYAKQAPGWAARAAPDGVTTTTPPGHTYGSSPPTLVMIRETPVRLDFVLAG